MKRGNDRSQLRAEEVEALNDEESEEAGTFKRASKEVLQQRKIYKISRNAYENKDSTSGTAPAASVGFGLPLTATAPSVSFAKSPITDTSITHQNNASLDTNSKPFTSLPINSNIKKPSAEENEQYKTEMKKLNESFLNWLNKQANENIESIWTDAMEDYIKYSKDIAEKHPIAADYYSALSSAENNPTESASAPVKPSIAPVPAHIPSSLDISTKTQDVSKPVTVPSVSATSSVPFSSLTSTIPTVTAPTSSTSFSNGGTSSTSANPFGGFSFNATTPSTASSNTHAAADTTIKPSVATPFAGFSFSATTDNATVIPPTASVIREEKKPATTAFAGFTGLTGFTIPKPADTTAASTGGFFNLTAPVTITTAPVSTGFVNPFGSGTSATTGGFTGIPTIPVSSSFSLPSFGSTAVKGTVNPSLGDDDDGGDDDEGEPILEPEKILRNEDDKDIQLHEISCKLFKFKPDSKEWGDLGKCSFRVTKTPDTGRQRIIIRNLMGKPLVNAYFYKDMKLEQNKNSIKFALFVAEEDGTKGMKSFNVKFNPAEVDNTMKILSAGVASVK